MNKFVRMMVSSIVLSLSITANFAFANIGTTAETADQSNQATMTADDFLLSLQPKSGKIELGNGLASMDLPDNFQYLTPDSAERLLVEGWGNPPGNETLGMVIPADINPVSRSGWGVVITYDEDGHVSDKDADEIDYDELLGDMKESNKEANKRREEAGYGTMELIGWAETPHYSKSSHKMYWAKEFKTDYDGENSLNYNIRVLGRTGVLVLNAVAGMGQIDMIKTETKPLLSVTEFKPSHRYEDFDSSTDHMAEYGIAAMVAGGVMAKSGLFAKLLAMIIAFKKIILIGVVAIGGLFAKLLGRKKS